VCLDIAIARMIDDSGKVTPAAHAAPPKAQACALRRRVQRAIFIVFLAATLDIHVMWNAAFDAIVSNCYVRTLSAGSH
jgi:hypothetical protein